MIFDRLPLNANDVVFLPFAAPVAAVKVAGPPDTYTFNSTTQFKAEGSTLYLFDSYTAIGSITQEQFAASVALGAATMGADGVFYPRFNITFPSTQGGRPTGFPTLVPAFYGLTPTRIFAQAPSSASFFIEAKIDGTLHWNPVTMGTAPASISFFYGINVYAIKDQEFIERYKKGEYPQ